MFPTLTPRRAARALAAAAALTFAAACNDSTGPDEDHADDVAALRLTVTPSSGTAATYTLADNGTLTPSPMRLPVGAATVRVDFLDDAGAVITSELPTTEYEIRFASLPAGVSFARTGAFAGTFTATTAGTGTMQALLWHLEEDHEDLGPLPIAVQIGN